MQEKVETSLIQIKNLNKSFGNNKVLSNINLSINKGDVYGVLGLSGAGKSTLMSILFGLYKQDSGEVLVDGKSKKNSSTYSGYTEDNKLFCQGNVDKDGYQSKLCNHCIIQSKCLL